MVYTHSLNSSIRFFPSQKFSLYLGPSWKYGLRTINLSKSRFFPKGVRGLCKRPRTFLLIGMLSETAWISLFWCLVGCLVVFCLVFIFLFGIDHFPFAIRGIFESFWWKFDENLPLEAAPMVCLDWKVLLNGSLWCLDGCWVVFCSFGIVFLDNFHCLCVCMANFRFLAGYT